MKVKVREDLVEDFIGFYGVKRRRPGQVFELVDRKKKDGSTLKAKDQFSERWMEKVNKPGPKPKDDFPDTDEE